MHDNAHILEINVLINNWQLSKHGTPLTSITWPYRGLKCRPIEVKYFLKLSSATSFQVIAGSSLFLWLIHMKYVVSGAGNRLLVVFMCRTIKILISNWPRTRKFSQLLQAGKTVAFDFSHHGHSLRPIFMLWLVKIWQVSSCRILCSFLKLVYFDSWSWQSFVSTCDAFNCLFLLDVQNEIQLLSRVFCYSWLVCLLGFGWEIRCLSKSEIRFRLASFSFYTLLDA